MSEAFPQVRMSAIYGVCHYWIRVAFDLFFRGEVVGTEHLPKSGAFLIAANHASHLDPPLIGTQSLLFQPVLVIRKDLGIDHVGRL